MISVQNVSKAYRLYAGNTDRLIETFLPSPHTRAKEFWAVRHVSFHVAPGEVFGIIGPNGSGKSTLLQIVSGILQPTSGRVLTQGRVASLLELGAGFNPEFTGRENVYLNGEIMGIRRTETKRLFDHIEQFAGIGQFIDRPVREYSTGMYVRLAFSAAIHVHPDILVVDEALAVGDAAFAVRCVRKFEELTARGVTVLLVSHDLGLVKRLAHRAMFMLNGEVRVLGTPAQAANEYVAFALQREDGVNDSSNESTGLDQHKRHGDGASRIVSIELRDRDGIPRTSFETGEFIVVHLDALFHRDVDRPKVGILVRNRIGIDVFGTNTVLEGVEFGTISRGSTVHVEFSFACLLAQHEYTLTVASQYDDGTAQDWIDDAITFRVSNPRNVAGVLSVPTRVQYSIDKT